MAILCASCGMENTDDATLCRRCRAPLETDPRARDVGQLCGRCESYNEPGVERCTTCGYKLPKGRASAPEPAAPEPAPPAPAPRESAAPEASEPEPEAPEPATAPEDDMPLAFALEEPTAASDPSPKRPAEPATKACASCGAENPAVARFCFECGTPFGKPTAPPVPAAEENPPDAWAETTDPSAWAAPELGGGEEHALSPEELGAELVTAPVLAEVPPPFTASLVVERGTAPGATYPLDRIENVIGGASGSNVELPGDAHVAPRAASIAFIEERLVLRDEGSANGIYLKLRESSPLAPGDLFIAGEHLIRYDGPCEPRAAAASDTRCLGSPMPDGQLVRVCEILRGGRVGRVCYRAGPVVSIGRSNCDLNFPADAQLAGRHAEVRIGPRGEATLVDVGAAPTGVFVRVGTQQERELTPGDVLQIGEQVLRVEFGA